MKSIGIYSVIIAIALLGGAFGVSSSFADRLEGAAARDPLDSSALTGATSEPLEDDDRAWLMQALQNHEIRLATADDIKAWEAKAAARKRPVTTILTDAGRTYVILKFITIPDNIAPRITYIIAKGIRFPDIKNWSAIYDLNTGGLYQAGSYDDGKEVGTGEFPESANVK